MAVTGSCLDLRKVARALVRASLMCKHRRREIVRMRLAATISTLLLLAACGVPVESERPLFMAGHDRFKSGLWAIMPADEPCTAPNGTQVLHWPDCATPILIENGRATYLQPGPTHVGFIIADGDPRIVQLETNVAALGNNASDAGQEKPDRRFYQAFTPETPSPFSAGRLQLLFCSSPESTDQPPIEGLRSIDGGTEDDKRCVADRASAIRELARRATAQDAGMRFIWIADYP